MIFYFYIVFSYYRFCVKRCRYLSLSSSSSSLSTRITWTNATNAEQESVVRSLIKILHLFVPRTRNSTVVFSGSGCFFDWLRSSSCTNKHGLFLERWRANSKHLRKGHHQKRDASPTASTSPEEVYVPSRRRRNRLDGKITRKYSSALPG